MKAFILVTLLATVLGAAIDNDFSSSNINYGTAIKMYYTSFQRIMPCGIPELEIPVLAPFTLDYYPVNVTNENYNITGNVANLEVAGLNSFRHLSGDFDESTNRSSFDIIFPQIQILGNYDVNAVVNLAGFPIQTAGKGLINIKIEDYRIVGNYVLAPNSQNPNGLEVTDINLQFHLGNVVNNNWNNLWDIAFNNFVNKQAAEISLMWAQEFQFRVNDVYAKYAVPQLNEVLQNVSMQDLINLLVSQSAQFDMVECNKH